MENYKELTKIEKFTIEAMKSLAVNPDNYDAADVPKMAVKMAIDTLQELKDLTK